MKKSKASARTQKSRSLNRVVVPSRERVAVLSRALGTISGTLCDVGIGHVVLGKLSRHMLELRHNGQDQLRSGQTKEKHE